MTHDIRTFSKDFWQALEHVLEHYWKDERDDFCSEPNHKRSLYHIYYSLRTIRRALRKPPKPLDLHALLASRKQVAIVGSITDVRELRPDLTDEESWGVLVQCSDVHDCNYGFTWELLKAVADDMYPAPDETEEGK